MQIVAPYAPAPALWTQLLTALIIGLLTTFAFQFLLTSLGLALGISVWSLRPVSDNDSAMTTSDKDLNKSFLSVDGLVGLGILGTVNLGLFSACFLAAKFSQMEGPATGAIAGITIWSAYLLLMLWVSAQTVNSVAGFLLDRATGGLRRLVGAMAQIFQSNRDLPVTEEQLADSVRQEVQAALQSTELRTLLENQLQTLAQSHLVAVQTPTLSERVASPTYPLSQSPTWQAIMAYLEQSSAKSLSPKRLDRKLEKILQVASEDEPAGLYLPPFETRALEPLLEQREDLSPKRKQRILNQVEKSWQQYRAERVKAASPVAIPTDDSPEEEPLGLPASLLRSALEMALKQVGERLPNLLLQPAQSTGLGLASMVLSTALSNLQSSVETLETPSIDVAKLQQQLDALIEESPLDLTQIGQSALTQAGNLRDWALQPLDSVQDALSCQVSTLKAQARHQAEMTRKNAAKAAWWLFATASTGACSAAIAGALATGLKLPYKLPWEMLQGLATGYAR